jgi:hypothetical protein
LPSSFSHPSSGRQHRRQNVAWPGWAAPHALQIRPVRRRGDRADISSMVITISANSVSNGYSANMLNDICGTSATRRPRQPM